MRTYVPLMAFLLLIKTPAEAKEKMVCAFNHVPPFMVKDKSNAQNGIGAANALVRLAAEEAGFEIEFKEASLSMVYQMVTSNKVDCLTFAAGPDDWMKSKEAEGNVWTKTAYYELQAGVYMAKDSAVQKIESSKDLMNQKICTKSDMPLTPTVTDKKLNIRYISGDDPLERCLQLLVLGKVDAVYTPAIVELKLMSTKLGILDKVKAVNFPDKRLPVYSLFSKKGAEKFLTKYEDSLKKIIAKKNFETMIDDYIASSVSK